MEKGKRGKLIWAAGISGCGRKEHLAGWERYCRKRGKKVKVYHIGQMIFEWDAARFKRKIPKDTILNVHNRVLDTSRSSVLDNIFFGIEKDLFENDIVIISLHENFYWRGTYIPVFNDFEIMRFRPDMVVCFIDKGLDILDRLNKTNQWRGQGLTEKDVLLWQNVEVNDTFRSSRLCFANLDRKVFVIPVKQPVSTLYCLLFEPWRPIVYVEMPISHAEPKDLEIVKRFIRQLWKRFVVFDPLTIDTGVVEIRVCSFENSVVHEQTAYRDLYWYIPQCDICIAYIFKPVFTFGVVDETVEASQSGKEAWVVFKGGYSPFCKFRAMPDRIFQRPEELFRFVDKEYLPLIYDRCKR